MSKNSKTSKYLGFDSKDEYYKILSMALDKSMMGVCIADAQGHYLYSNKAHADFSGYSGDMMKNMNASEVSRLLEFEESSTLAVLKSKKEVYIDQTLKSRDLSLLVKGVPYFDSNNEVKYVISNIMDVSKVQALKQEIEQERQEKAILNQQVEMLKEHLEQYTSPNDLIFKSSVMQNLMDQVRLLDNADATVLILGESGTGKEMLARVLHEKSDRRDKPFYKLNCSAIPESLMESELFGYEAGAFTGGSPKGKKGILEYANHGTVLLDEIGTLPLFLQSKLLRVLQEREFTRIGGHEPIKIDIRFIAATNSDLLQLVQENKFRMDLYYRLNVIPLRIPPLRERIDDIPLLIHYFMDKFNKKYHKEKTISSEAISAMIRMKYEGNVRELENLVERLVLLSSGITIQYKHLQTLNLGVQDKIPLNEIPDTVPKDITYDDIKERSWKELMEEYEGKILKLYKDQFDSTYKIARLLKVNQSTIHRKLARIK